MTPQRPGRLIVPCQPVRALPRENGVGGFPHRERRDHAVRAVRELRQGRHERQLEMAQGARSILLAVRSGAKIFPPPLTHEPSGLVQQPTHDGRQIVERRDRLVAEHRPHEALCPIARAAHRAPFVEHDHRVGMVRHHLIEHASAIQDRVVSDQKLQQPGSHGGAQQRRVPRKGGQQHRVLRVKERRRTL